MSSKFTIHVNIHKLYAVHYNNTEWSLDIRVTISYSLIKLMLKWTRECKVEHAETWGCMTGCQGIDFEKIR